MDFEKILKDKLKKEIINNLNQFNITFNTGDSLSNITKEVLENFIDIIDIYNFRKYKNQKTEDEILDMGDNFKELFTDDNLAKVYENINFTDEELMYIRYVKLSHKWRNFNEYNIMEKYAIEDILLKRFIYEKFGKESIDVFKDIIRNEMKNNPRMNYFLQLLSENIYGDSLEQDFYDEIEKQVNQNFNRRINCGGYALKIDTCVFPFYCKDFSQSVSTILDRFPFTRLLGDSKLEDDEYLVLYRANENNTGHHFILVDDDGIVKEKDALGSPQVFKRMEWT